jgi:hypothetical protein
LHTCAAAAAVHAANLPLQWHVIVVIVLSRTQSDDGTKPAATVTTNIKHDHQRAIFNFDNTVETNNQCDLTNFLFCSRSLVPAHLY